MKQIKKIIFSLVVLLTTALVLVACDKPQKVDLEAAKTALKITYETGEDFNTVKTKVTLPTKVEGHEGVTVAWASDKPEVISTAGAVVRQDENTIVTLTATLSAEKQDSVTKDFKVTVLAKEKEEPVVDKTKLKTLLDAHYAETIAKRDFLVETETLELVKTIGEFTEVTWTSNNPAVINAETGAVTRPVYSGVEEVSVVLTAKAEGQNNVNYVVKVKELEETLDSKLDKELARLTNFPSGYKPILKVSNLELNKLKDVKVDGEKVTEATWTSNNPEYFDDTGKRLDKEFEGTVDISFTITFTYQEITKTKTVEFRIAGATVYENFTAAINGANKAVKGEVIKVTNVAKYEETEDGYYLVDNQGILMFIYGKTKMPAKGKVFDVKAEYDLYYSSPQLKTPEFTETTGTPTAPKVTEITLADLVSMTVPNDANPLVHQLYKVTGAKLHVFNASDSYMTYLVPQAHADATKQPTKADSMMLYYQTQGGLARLQALANGNQTYSNDFEYITIVVNAFRTNNDIYAFMFLGLTDNEDLLKVSLTAKETAELALKEAANTIKDHIIFDGENFTLPATYDYKGQTYNITYESNNAALVGNDGVVAAFPAIGTISEATFTLTTTDTDNETVTLEKPVKVGREASITIDAAVAKAKDALVFFEAYYHVGINNTHQFVDGSVQGAAVRFARGVDTSNLTAGKKYLVHATKAGDFNGLRQFNGVQFKLVEGSDPIVPKAYTGDFSNDSFLAIQNSIISVDDLIVKSVPTKDQYGNVTYVLKNSIGKELAFREHSSNSAHGATLLALGLAVGDRVKLTSAVVSWYNNPQFIYGHMEKVETTPEQLFNESVDRLKLNLPAEDTLYYANFELPVTFEELAIVWTVTEGGTAAAVAADGKVTVTKQAERTTVKLSGSVTQDTHTATVTVQVVIAKEGEEPSTNVATDLFISEYIEGTSNNKAIEIYNGTGAAVNLSNYRVTLFSNGSSEHHATNIATFTVDQVLNPGETLVIYNSGSSELLKARLTHAAISITSTVTYFNGDDALALEKKNGEAWDRIDVFGVIGVDPGTNWPVGDGSTLDNTLVRNANVGSPSATWDVTQWDVHPKDTFTHLGTHTFLP